MNFGPTHWNVRDDLAEFANRFSSRNNLSWNSYRDHPPGMGLDYVSVDFWGPGGRGDRLALHRMRDLARSLRRSKTVPPWRWIIAGNKGWYPGGATFTPPGGAEANAGHVHITVR